jgi:hypothetical protein
MDLIGMTEREYFADVAKRPGMFIGRTTLRGLEGYLEGYHAHSLRHGGPGLDWRDWLVRHIALPGGWNGELTPGQEERVIKVMFQLLDE